MHIIHPLDASAVTKTMNNRNHIVHQLVLTASAVRSPLTNCTTADQAAEAAVMHGMALSRHYEKTRPRHPPQDLARMIDDAFPMLPADCQPRQLSPSEIIAITSALRNATVERQRKEITALHSQMAEHHALLDRLERLQEKHSALQRAHDERCLLVEELEEQVAVLSECCQQTADIEEEDRGILSSSSHHRPISRAESTTTSGPTADAESISSKISDDERTASSPGQTLSAEATRRLRELYAMPPLRRKRKVHASKSPPGPKMVGREGRGGGHVRAREGHQAITPLVMPRAVPATISEVVPRFQSLARSHHVPTNVSSQLQASSLVAQSSPQVHHWHAQKIVPPTLSNPQPSFTQKMAPPTLSNPQPSFTIAPLHHMTQEGVPVGVESYAQAYGDFCTPSRQYQAFRFQIPRQDPVWAGKRQRLDDVRN
ncbi:hypothetical protein THAOC_20822 [Thalassiosira oceanica]|uniref:Uncharacterized protein n=1 Tax=Thalassiosira oceanica TaxID=159749 RepID=K0RYX4_THAOC|nr:hypothetical protein THAOC_20822 [Thalassiosira oceanica]|eukprot:EJK59013.1 hypothetical protein THAOC_20822 [Thalassiosira oceanica]